MFVYSNQTSVLRIGTDSNFIGSITAPVGEVSVAGRTITHGMIQARRLSVEPDVRLMAQ